MQKKRYRKDKSQWVVYRTERLRIVSDPLWQTAQRNRLSNTRKDFGHGPKRAAYALTGLIKCGGCGGSVGGHWQQNADGSNSYYYYRCRGAMNGEGRCSNKAKIKGIEIEKALIEKIERDLFSEKFLEEVVWETKRRYREWASRKQDAEKMRKRLKKLTEEIGRLAELAAAMPVELSEVAGKIAEREEERKQLAGLLAKAGRHTEIPSDDAIRAAVGKEAGRTLDLIKSAQDVAELRMQFMEWIDGIRLDENGAVWVKWKMKTIAELQPLAASSEIGEAGSLLAHLGHWLGEWHRVEIAPMPSRVRRRTKSPEATRSGFSGFSGTIGFSGFSGFSTCPESKDASGKPAQELSSIQGFSSFSDNSGKMDNPKYFLRKNSEVRGFSGFAA